MVALEALGIEADEDQMREIVAAIKQRALQTKALLPLDEVVRLANSVLAGTGKAPALVGD